MSSVWSLIRLFAYSLVALFAVRSFAVRWNRELRRCGERAAVLRDTVVTRGVLAPPGRKWVRLSARRVDGNGDCPDHCGADHQEDTGPLSICTCMLRPVNRSRRMPKNVIDSCQRVKTCKS